MKVIKSNNTNNKFVKLVDLSNSDYYEIEKRFVPLTNVYNGSAIAHLSHLQVLNKCVDLNLDNNGVVKLVDDYIELIRKNKNSINYTGNPNKWLRFLNLKEYQTRDYQLAGMDRLWELKKAILADDVGIGKTPQSLAVMARALHNQNGCCVVITTASTKGQWVDEIQRFTPQLKVQLIDGNIKQREYRWSQNADIYVLSYDYLKKIGMDLTCLYKLNPLVVIFDEAYRLGGINSNTHKNSVKFASTVDRVIMLHATPIERGLENLYALMKLLDSKVFGSYDQFKNRFMVMKPKPAYISKHKKWFPKLLKYINLKDFRFRILPYIIRRTVVDVKLQLPEIISSPVYISLNSTDETEYRKQVKIALGSRIPNIAALRVSLIDSKLDDLKARLLGELTNERIIVFSQYEKSINLASKKLCQFNPFVISGKIPNNKRAAIVRNFINSNRSILLMTEAGSRGLNLQSARVVINLDLPWTHAQLRQRIGRINRIGQKADNILVLNYVGVYKNGKQTVDHWLLSLLSNRRDLHSNILSDDYSDEIGVENIRPAKFMEVLKNLEKGVY